MSQYYNQGGQNIFNNNNNNNNNNSNYNNNNNYQNNNQIYNNNNNNNMQNNNYNQQQGMNSNNPYQNNNNNNSNNQNNNYNNNNNMQKNIFQGNNQMSNQQNIFQNSNQNIFNNNNNGNQNNNNNNYQSMNNNNNNNIFNNNNQNSMNNSNNQIYQNNNNNNNNSNKFVNPIIQSRMNRQTSNPVGTNNNNNNIFNNNNNNSNMNQNNQNIFQNSNNMNNNSNIFGNNNTNNTNIFSNNNNNNNNSNVSGGNIFNNNAIGNSKINTSNIFTNNNNSNLNNRMGGNNSNIFNNNTNQSIFKANTSGNSSIFGNNNNNGSILNNNNGQANIFRQNQPNGLLSNQSTNNIFNNQNNNQSIFNRNIQSQSLAQTSLYNGRFILPPPKRFQVKRLNEEFIDPEGWVGGYLKLKNDGKVIKLDKQKMYEVQNALNIYLTNDNDDYLTKHGLVEEINGVKIGNMSGTSGKLKSNFKSDLGSASPLGKLDLNLSRVGISLNNQLRGRQKNKSSQSLEYSDFFAKDDKLSSRYISRERHNQSLSVDDRRGKRDAAAEEQSFKDNDDWEELMYRQNQFYAQKPKSAGVKEFIGDFTKESIGESVKEFDTSKEQNFINSYNNNSINSNNNNNNNNNMNSNNNYNSRRPVGILKKGSLNGDNIIQNKENEWQNQYGKQKSIDNLNNSFQALAEERKRNKQIEEMFPHLSQKNRYWDELSRSGQGFKKVDQVSGGITQSRQSKKYNSIQEMENDPHNEMYLPARIERYNHLQKLYSSDIYLKYKEQKEAQYAQIGPAAYTSVNSESNDHRNATSSKDKANTSKDRTNSTPPSDLDALFNPLGLIPLDKLSDYIKANEKEEEDKKSNSKGFFNIFNFFSSSSSQPSQTQQSIQMNVNCFITNISTQKVEQDATQQISVNTNTSIGQFLENYFHKVSKRTGLIWHAAYNNLVSSSLTYVDSKSIPVAMTPPTKFMKDFRLENNNQFIVEFFISEAPILLNSSYEISPSIQNMRSWPIEELQNLQQFQVKNEHGSIFFEKAVDLTRQNLDEIIIIEQNKAYVYPDHIFSGKCPKPGNKLNQQAIVTLYCIDQKAYESHKQGTLKYEQIERKLKNLCIKNNTEFISFDRNTFHFSFRVFNWNC